MHANQTAMIVRQESEAGSRWHVRVRQLPLSEPGRSERMVPAHGSWS
jgi:hypothetical protein